MVVVVIVLTVQLTCALYKDSANLIFSFVDIVTMISKSSGNEN